MYHLKSWDPLNLSRTCFFKLHEVKDFEDFSDWKIYWIAGITSLRSVWHVLAQQDSKHSELTKSIINDYNNGPANWEIFQSFVRNQRNRTIKQWKWDIVPIEVSARKWLGGEFLGEFTDLVFNYPKFDGDNCTVPKDLQGEDPIRLLGIAIKFLHKDLSIIELAIKSKNSQPFSENRISETEYAQSAYSKDEPHFYR